MGKDTYTHDTLDKLPDEARARAMLYMETVSKSQSAAAAMRDLGYKNKEVAEHLGVSQDAASSYYSKFRTNLHNTLPFIISSFGGPKHICSWQIVPTEAGDEYWFAVKSIEDAEDIKKARGKPSTDGFFIPHGEIALIKVKPEEFSFEAETTKYDSIEEMANEIYRNVKFEDKSVAHNIRALFTESGMPENSLEAVSEKIERANKQNSDEEYDQTKTTREFIVREKVDDVRWLELANEPKKQHQFGIPVCHEKYDDRILSEIRDLETGEKITATIVSTNEKNTAWRFESIETDMTEETE